MARRTEQMRGQVSLPAGGPQKPFIDPRIDTRAAYEAGMRARMAAALPKTTEPVAGGRGPAIPRLDEHYQAGRTMSHQAEAVREQRSVPIGNVGIVEAPNLRPDMASPASLGILPIDLLPEQAANDPNFQSGHGSMYAASQPRLAMKYGVMRNGQFIPPQKLQPPANQLRAETVKGLETLAKLQETQAGPVVGSLHGSEEDAVRSVEGTAAAAAARVGNAPGDVAENPLSAKEKGQIEESISKLDEFDLDSFRQAMMKDILNNTDQKQLIESKLKPISIDDLIYHNRATQLVPIREGLSFTLQSMTGEEDLAIKRLIMSESKGVDVSDRYLLDKYSFMSIAVGLKEINGKPFGAQVSDDKGNFDDAAFWTKFNRILKLPLHLLASIGVNIFWFEMRVRKLFVAEKVGNG